MNILISRKTKILLSQISTEYSCSVTVS